jgi:hypothetical protein
MPSLVWPSIVLITLLLPGFFFQLGLYAPERFSRDTAPRNPLTTLGTVVLVSIIVHAVLDWTGRLSTTAGVAWNHVLDTMHIGGTTAQATSERILGYYDANPILIPIYIFVTAFAGYLLGLAAGWLSVKGFIPGAIQFPWAYELRNASGGAKRINYVHVLSNVEHDGKALLYRGRLHHFGLNGDGTFAYIAIGATEQRFLDLGGGDPSLRDRTPIGGTLGTAEVRRNFGGLGGKKWHAKGGALLMISGANIRSTVFQGEYELNMDSMVTAMQNNPALEDELQQPDPTRDPEPASEASESQPQTSGSA